MRRVALVAICLGACGSPGKTADSTRSHDGAVSDGAGIQDGGVADAGPTATFIPIALVGQPVVMAQDQTANRLYVTLAAGMGIAVVDTTSSGIL